MTSLFANRFAATGSPVGNRFAGESVTRYPGGNTGDAESQTVRVTLSDSDLVTTGGRSVVTDGQLVLTEADSVGPSDRYKIGNDVFTVMKIDPVRNGERVVHVSRVTTPRKEARAGRNLR